MLECPYNMTYGERLFALIQGELACTFAERAEMGAYVNPPTPEACWKGCRTQLATLVDDN